VAAIAHASRQLGFGAIAAQFLQKAGELTRVVETMYQFHKRRQTVRRLLELDDRLLDDVGITLEDVKDARRRWWV
jgi:uncharacterized protein YjiS (DUF1127 family)